MRHTITARLAALTLPLSLAVALPACVGERPRSVGASLVEVCAGTYACTSDGGDRFDVTLGLSGGACLADGELVLGDDGSVEAPLDPEWPTGDVYWTGDTARFDICSRSAAACIRCADPAASPPTEPAPRREREDPPGRCLGYAPSCYSQPYGRCALVDGCYGVSRLRWDGSWDNHCEGSATQCRSYTREGLCNLQRGCRWED